MPGSGSVTTTDEKSGFRIPVASGGWAAPFNPGTELRQGPHHRSR